MKYVSYQGIWILITIIITLVLLCCRTLFDFYVTWPLSDYIGIISLGIGILSLEISLWTLYRAVIIEHRASIIENEVLRVKKEHLFTQRIKDHKKTITRTKDVFKKKRELLYDSEQQIQRQDFNDLQEVANECSSSCNSLLEKIPEELHEPVRDLYNACQSFEKVMIDYAHFHESVEDLYKKLCTALYRIDEFEKDRKARMS